MRKVTVPKGFAPLPETAAVSVTEVPKVGVAEEVVSFTVGVPMDTVSVTGAEVAAA